MTIMNRINKLRPAIYRNVVDALYVDENSEETMRYFSGYFAPNTTLMVCRNRQFLITDAAHKEEAEKTATDFEVFVIDENTTVEDIIIDEVLPSQSIKRLGYESKLSSTEFVDAAKPVLRKHGVSFVDVTNTVERIKKTVD